MARDRFGEDGWEVGSGTPSSLDVVFAVYAQLAPIRPEADVHDVACEALSYRLRTRTVVRRTQREAIAAFVSAAIPYLAYQYPEGAGAETDRQMIAHLFWQHLVEARWAAR